MPDQPENTPAAMIEPITRTRWVWALPVLAGVAALILIATYVLKIGPLVTLTMGNGFGLKAGDAVRSLGVEIGRVEEVTLLQADGRTEVQATLRLERSARDVARVGSRFWVVRPTLSLAGISGLETIAGPRYVAVIPGPGDRRTRFVALDEPPVVEELEPNGLEVLLSADRRGSLRPGSPVLYRQVDIGTILSVGLASDAAGVEVRAYIRPQYANLVRDNSVFWNASGIGVEAGLSGLRLDVESLRSLVEGGVSMATPNAPGATVHTGHRFPLASREQIDEAWMDWKPALAVGTAMLPAGAARPDMQRVTVNRSAGFLRGDKTMTGWALPTAQGLIGPADLLTPSEKNNALEVAGKSFDLTADAPAVHPLPDARLARFEAAVPGARPWPADSMRAMTEAEDCLIVADPAGEAIPLPAIRLVRDGDHWALDGSIGLDPALHGAAVLARSDGKIIGLLLVENGAGSIASPTNTE